MIMMMIWRLASTVVSASVIVSQERHVGDLRYRVPPKPHYLRRDRARFAMKKAAGNISSGLPGSKFFGN